MEHQRELDQKLEHKTNVVTDVLFEVFTGLFNQIVKLRLTALQFHIPQKFQFVDSCVTSILFESDEARQKT